MADGLTSRDLELLAHRGIDAAEAERQLGLLRAPPRYLELVRPCTASDGIARIAPADRAGLIAAHEVAARDGRLTAFVPASGAATRMFRDVLSVMTRRPELTAAELEEDVDAGLPDARAVAAVMLELDKLALAPDLGAELQRQGEDLHALMDRGDYGEVLDALVRGLRCAEQPKGLLPFHRTEDGPRRAFEEHLIEAADVLCDRRGTCRLHFTVSDDHLDGFRSLLARVRRPYEKRFGVSFDVSFSVQKPSTDTLALDGDGNPFRTEDGALLLRPSGHGALIDNLAELGADLALVKNIDNVVPEERKAATYVWERLLIGRLVLLQQRIHAALADLDARRSGAAEAARDLLRQSLEIEVDDAASPRQLARQLDRPLRVAGMVVNTGEPGGGPFWVRRGEALSRQIVEGSEVNPSSEQQRALFRASTHFNPVFMALALRDRHGRLYDLRRFVDPGAAILTRKSQSGRELIALERPGLWNGSMALWNTVFVEVPIDVFNPVKTINDLLRPEHQPSL